MILARIVSSSFEEEEEEEEKQRTRLKPRLKPRLDPLKVDELNELTYELT